MRFEPVDALQVMGDNVERRVFEPGGKQAKPATRWASSIFPRSLPGAAVKTPTGLLPRGGQGRPGKKTAYMADVAASPGRTPPSNDEPCSATPRSADVLALTPVQFAVHVGRGIPKRDENRAKAGLGRCLFTLGHIMADRMVAGNQRLKSKASSEFLRL